MSFNPEQPYNDLPYLPPQVDIETKAILRKTTAAARALCELKSVGAMIPNQQLLVGSILLLEAQVSSEIENTVTTSDKLFQLAASTDSETDASTKEAYRYSQALREGSVLLQRRPLGVRSALEICQTIRNAEVQVRTMSGTRIADSMSRRVIYTPPDAPDRLDALLRNWEEYLNRRDEVDPLIKVALLHYQFEAIHPFTDGNGRTGRILNILYLLQEGLLEVPVLYLSRYILERRSDYYGLLRGVTENAAWEPWILYVLDAMEETARWTLQRISAIQRLMEHTREFMLREESGIYSRELLELLFIQPYVRIGNVIESGIASRDTASLYLKKLVRAGVLFERKRGRDKLFFHSKLYELLMSDRHEFEPYA